MNPVTSLIKIDKVHVVLGGGSRGGEGDARTFPLERVRIPEIHVFKMLQCLSRKSFNATEKRFSFQGLRPLGLPTRALHWTRWDPKRYPDPSLSFAPTPNTKSCIHSWFFEKLFMLDGQTDNKQSEIGSRIVQRVDEKLQKY